MSLTIEQKDSNGNIVVSTAGKNDAVLVSSGYSEGDKLSLIHIWCADSRLCCSCTGNQAGSTVISIFDRL